MESLFNSPGDRNLDAELTELIVKRAAGGIVRGSLTGPDGLKFAYADLEVMAYLRDHYDGVMVRFGGTKLLVFETVPTVVRMTKENLRIILENGCRYPLVTVGISGGDVFDNRLCRVDILSTMIATRVNEAQLDLTLRSMTQQYHNLPLELGQPELNRAPDASPTEAKQSNKAQGQQLAPIDESLLAESLQKLDSLIGLREVKDQISSFVALARYRRAQEAIGLTVPQFSPHMVFRGNPGTCKTTVASIIGDIYKALGLLKRGRVKVVGRGDLVGQFSGQTAPLTQAACDEAHDSILFIDEAYSLTQGRDGFGLEAIQTLLVEMENNRGRIAVIVAGYPKEMDDFLQANPGLRSRFDVTVDFPDYSDRELVEILISMASVQSLTFSADAYQLIEAMVVKIPRGREFGNGREARRWLEAIVQEQARNWDLAGGTDQAALNTIEAAAVETALTKFAAKKPAAEKPVGFLRGR